MRSGIIVKTKGFRFPKHSKLQTPQRWFKCTSKPKSSIPNRTITEINRSSLNSLFAQAHLPTLQNFLNSQTLH